MPNHSLTAAQADALADMIACWGVDRVALIGAHALGCHIELTWRETGDLDVTVLTTMDAYPDGLHLLEGWRRDSRVPHRWYSPRDVSVDVLPTHADVLAEGPLQWPGDSAVLSLVGMRLVNDLSRPVKVAGNVAVRVPPVPVLVLLKMASYLDRPHARRRDLQDLVHVLRKYPPADDDRLYTDDVFDRALTAQQAGPYVLGREIRALNLAEEELQLVIRFLDELREDAPLAVMTREVGALAEPAEAIPLLDALRLGFYARSS